jgi:hypothetical protein
MYGDDDLISSIRNKKKPEAHSEPVEAPAEDYGFEDEAPLPAPESDADRLKKRILEILK